MRQKQRDAIYSAIYDAVMDVRVAMHHRDDERLDRLLAAIPGEAWKRIKRELKIKDLP